MPSAASATSSDAGEEAEETVWLDEGGQQPSTHRHRHALLGNGGRQRSASHTATYHKTTSGKRTMPYTAVVVVCILLCVAAIGSLATVHLQSTTAPECPLAPACSDAAPCQLPPALAPSATAPGSISSHIPLPSQFVSHYHLTSDSGELPVLSSHQCVGPDLLFSRKPDDYLYRRCVLHNVCLHRDINVSVANAEVGLVVEYFRPPEQVVGWEDPFAPLEPSGAPQPLVALRNGGRAERHEKLHSVVVRGRDANESRGRHFIPGSHVLHQLLASGDMNFGHFLLDDVYGVWETVRSFDPAMDGSVTSGGGGDEQYVPDNVQVLLITGCANFSAPLDKMCAKFAAALFPVVSSRPVLDWRSAYFDSQPLCLSRLVVGTGSVGAVGWSPDNRNRAPHFAAFRSSIYEVHGLLPYNRPTRHHLVLVDKRGRRGFTNLRAMYEQLKLTPRYAEVQMTVVSDLAAWTLQQQLSLLATATILLSPCGGISMMALLAPYPATLIVSTYPERQQNGTVRSVRMEGHVWDWQSNVHVVHYPLLDDSDFELPSGVDPTSRYALRNQALTVLKINRLRQLIDQAILRAAAIV